MNRNWLVLLVTGLSVAGCGFDTSAQGLDGGPEVDARPSPDANVDAGFDADPDNTPPSISAIADQITQNSPVGPLDFTVDDAETAPSNLVVSGASSDQAVVPDQNIAFGGSGGDRIVTVTPVASGTATITITVNDGSTNAFESFLVTVSNMAPDAVADSYNASGNSDININAAAGLLANDSDGDGDGLTVVADNIVSTMGGAVTIAADGSFSYLPPVGVTDVTDSFSYQVGDGFASSVGTASVTITELVWYVDNSAASAGDGRRSIPFQTLAEAESASGTGDIIFVHRGDGTSTGLDAGITLKEDQQLRGEDAGLTLGGQVLVAASNGNHPAISNTGGDGITLASRNQVRGVAVVDADNHGIRGVDIIDILIRDVVVTRAANDGIILENSDPSGTISVEIRDSTIEGNNTDFGTTGTAIDVQISGTSAGQLAADIRNNTITGVNIGILAASAGSTGSGAGGANLIDITGNDITDVDDDAVQATANGTSNSAFTITGNTLDGVQNIGTASPAIGINFGLSTLTGGTTSLDVSNNTITDMGEECAMVACTGNGNDGTLTASVSSNSFSACTGAGLLISPDDTATILATVDGNTATGNGAASTFEFATGSGPRLDLNLLNNEDSVGFELERGTNGIFNLAGALGQGSSFDDDNGNVADNGNTTGGGAPTVTIVEEASAQQINIVDPATIPTP